MTMAAPPVRSHRERGWVAAVLLAAAWRIRVVGAGGLASAPVTTIGPARSLVTSRVRPEGSEW